MKKITVYTFCIAFLAAGMASCAKTTKGKLTKEWKVVSYEKTRVGINQSGSSTNSTTSKISMTETSFIHENTHVDNNGAVVTDYYEDGLVNSHVLTMKKDGTWSWTKDITYVFNSGSTNRISTEESGTWSFVGKTKGDDFKKNERLLFNVLNKKESSLNIVDNVVVSDDLSNTTFLAGENMQIYTIKESKKKELQLELESNFVSESSSSGVNKEEGTLKITLKEK
ncbi:hypothetical protein D3C87_32980 [compost metagenome]